MVAAGVTAMLMPLFRLPLYAFVFHAADIFLPLLLAGGLLFPRYAAACYAMAAAIVPFAFHAMPLMPC